MRINGENVSVENGTTVEELLLLFDINLSGIAIERNREIVLKSRYADTALEDSDFIEVVRMTGGG